jgi:hypothetical protein
MKRTELPSRERLCEAFYYNPETGMLSWRVDCGRARTGDIASRATGSCGYIGVNIDGRSYVAHRVIWKMMTGLDPIDGIDHIDGNASNNRWGNLREASHVQNMANRKRPITNSSGVKGVSWHSSTGRWIARVGANNKRHTVGFFADVQSAEIAIEAARHKLHGEFARAL